MRADEDEPRGAAWQQGLQLTEDFREEMQPLLRARIGDGGDEEILRAPAARSAPCGGRAARLGGGREWFGVDAVPDRANRRLAASHAVAPCGFDGAGAGHEEIGDVVGSGDSGGPGVRHVVEGHREREAAGLDGAGFRGADEVGVDEISAEIAREVGDGLGARFGSIWHIGEIGEMPGFGKGEARGPTEGGDADADVLAREFLREIERHALRAADLDGRDDLQDAQRGIVVRVERGEMHGAEAAVADEALHRLAEGMAAFQERGERSAGFAFQIHHAGLRQCPRQPRAALQIAAAAREMARPLFLMPQYAEADERAAGGAPRKWRERRNVGQPGSRARKEQRAGCGAQREHERFGGQRGFACERDARGGHRALGAARAMKIARRESANEAAQGHRLSKRADDCSDGGGGRRRHRGAAADCEGRSSFPQPAPAMSRRCRRSARRLAARRRRRSTGGCR